jgi:hypothetical protein
MPSDTEIGAAVGATVAAGVQPLNTNAAIKTIANILGKSFIMHSNPTKRKNRTTRITSKA